MNELGVVTFWTLLALALGQVPLVWAFVRALRRGKQDPPAAQPCPKAAVVICLRGADPFLVDCLEAILDQDYPQYDVRVVIDSREDPAWQVVQDVIRRRTTDKLRPTPLTERRDTCSLKCSSVLQAISELDDSYEVVALLDADTIPHSGWLRQLVAPLADDQVGAATGNRWYMPADANWAALVRYVWNSAAVVQMFCHRIAWGGTLALKTKVLRDSDLLDRWGHAFCEDTMLHRVLRRRGLRVAFVPSLMMVNREACQMPGYFRWVRRQMLTARLYHPRWLAVVGHGLITSLAQAAAVGVLIAAMLTGHWQGAAWAGGGLACYQIAMLLFLAPMEVGVRRVVGARGEPTNWLAATTAAKLLPAVPLTQTIYSVVLISAILVRRVEWRGVSYQIDGPWEIRLIEYAPYEASHATADAMASL